MKAVCVHVNAVVSTNADGPCRDVDLVALESLVYALLVRVIQVRGCDPLHLEKPVVRAQLFTQTRHHRYSLTDVRGAAQLEMGVYTWCILSRRPITFVRFDGHPITFAYSLIDLSQALN